MNDKTVVLGKPMKRAVGARVWHNIMRLDDTRISAEAWVHFIAVVGLEQSGPNLWTDGIHEYTFERRKDDRA